MMYKTSNGTKKSSKNEVKNQSKKGPKIHQKSSKNGVKISQKSSKNGVWRAPGEVWRLLGPSWAIQRILESILDRLGGVMEASWPGKVANMAPTWPQVGAPKGKQNPSWAVLEASWEPLGGIM